MQATLQASSIFRLNLSFHISDMDCQELMRPENARHREHLLCHMTLLLDGLYERPQKCKEFWQIKSCDQTTRGPINKATQLVYFTSVIAFELRSALRTLQSFREQSNQYAPLSMTFSLCGDGDVFARVADCETSGFALRASMKAPFHSQGADHLELIAFTQRHDADATWHEEASKAYFAITSLMSKSERSKRFANLSFDVPVRLSLNDPAWGRLKNTFNTADGMCKVQFALSGDGGIGQQCNTLNGMSLFTLWNQCRRTRIVSMTSDEGDAFGTFGVRFSFDLREQSAMQSSWANPNFLSQNTFCFEIQLVRLFHTHLEFFSIDAIHLAKHCFAQFDLRQSSARRDKASARVFQLRPVQDCERPRFNYE